METYINSDFNHLLLDIFPGYVVNKGIVSAFKATANVPTYVIEYLVAAYCTTDEEEMLEAGKEHIRNVLDCNFIKPNMSEHTKMLIREEGSYKIIDKISAVYSERYDVYVARFENFESRAMVIPPEYIRQYDKLTLGGVWAVIDIHFVQTGQSEENPLCSPFEIASITPIQLASFDLDDFIRQRSAFSSDEWRTLVLRSVGYNPDTLPRKQQFHLLERMVPLIEHNYNVCELGARSTGKSYMYKEISPYSLLMTGGETTVANMFYNMSRKTAGLIAKWDCVAFDEVAGLPNSKADLTNSLKDYMESGSAARGETSVHGEASVVLVGNTDASPDVMQIGGTLFSPFPKNMRNDAAFFDRINYYIPGWDTPKLTKALLTEDYALSADIIAEFCHQMRAREMDSIIDKYFAFTDQYNVRDDKSVRKTFSGLAKLLYPDGNMTKEEVRELLEYAIEGRRRVKEQLFKMVPSEFAKYKLGYKDLITDEEIEVRCN